jgi:hypothetical protein
MLPGLPSIADMDVWHLRDGGKKPSRSVRITPTAPYSVTTCKVKTPDRLAPSWFSLVVRVLYFYRWTQLRPTQKSTDGSAGEPDREPVSHFQRTILVGLKSDFLSKHHVARD